MGLIDAYFEDPGPMPSSYYRDREDKHIEFSKQDWINILDILRDLSGGCYLDASRFESNGGTAWGDIKISNRWAYGEMHWTIPSPVRHDYTLQYEISTDALHQYAHFELAEEVLLPIDMSYIAPITDYILKNFPRSSIMTKRICTFEYYDYAI